MTLSLKQAGKMVSRQSRRVRKAADKWLVDSLVRGADLGSSYEAYRRAEKEMLRRTLLYSEVCARAHEKALSRRVLMVIDDPNPKWPKWSDVDDIVAAFVAPRLAALVEAGGTITKPLAVSYQDGCLTGTVEAQLPAAVEFVSIDGSVE